MVHGELEDQCQSHPAGAALSAGTNQVNSPRFLKSPTLRVLSRISPFFYSKCGIQTRCVCSTGRGTDIISLRLRSTVVKASAVPSLCYFKFCLLSKKVSYFFLFVGTRKTHLWDSGPSKTKESTGFKKTGLCRYAGTKYLPWLAVGRLGFISIYHCKRASTYQIMPRRRTLLSKMKGNVLKSSHYLWDVVNQRQS